MFQRILIPLDGSPRAELILPVLSPLWKRKASELHLVHSLSSYSPPHGGYDTTSSLAQMRDTAESYLRGVAGRLTDAGADVHTRVIEGSPAGAILDAAKRERATMIAMTTHGRTGVMRWLTGSVADKVLHGSDVPVLLVRPVEEMEPAVPEPAASREAPFRRILLAVDGSSDSMAAVGPAKQFAALFDSEIVALHVWDSYVLEGAPLLGMEAGMMPPPAAPLPAKDEVTAQVVRQLSSSGLKVTRATRYGEPASEIVDHSIEHHVDLIALTFHDHWELSRWMTGSVAERVLRSAKVPLLLVRVAGNLSLPLSPEPAR